MFEFLWTVDLVWCPAAGCVAHRAKGLGFGVEGASGSSEDPSFKYPEPEKQSALADFGHQHPLAIASFSRSYSWKSSMCTVP